MKSTSTSVSKSVSIVSMPWADPTQTSIQLGILKSVLTELNLPCRSLHFYLDFAGVLGHDLYTRLIAKPALNFFCEWLFSKEAFGVDNSREYINYLTERMTSVYSRLYDGTGTEDVLTYAFGADNASQIERIQNQLVPGYLQKCMSVILGNCATDIVGFSCVFSQMVPSLALAKLLKRASPSMKIVLGGNAVQGEMGQECLRSFPWVDYVVDGEGEISFPRLIRYIRSLHGQDGRGIRFPGIIYRDLDGNVRHSGMPRTVPNLDSVPMPDYDDFFEQSEQLQQHTSHDMVVRFETSRGCWWGEKSHCSFCAVNGRNLHFRVKSPDRVVYETFYLNTRYQSRHMYAVDSIADMGLLSEVLPKLETLDVDLDLFFEIRPNTKKAELLLMREAGLRLLQPGIESFSSPVLKIMHKGLRGIQNIQFLKWCRELNLKVGYHILWGFPGEKASWYSEMENLLPIIYHLEPPDFPPRLVNYQRYSPLSAEYGNDRLVPRADYGFIFPGNVELSKIAFAFEHPLEEEMLELGYIRGLAHKVKTWRELYYSKERPYLFYSRGIGFVQIWDSRDGMMNRTTLSRASAKVFLFCESIRNIQQIYHLIEASFPGEYNETEKLELLSHLESEHLLIREGNLFLTLAIPLNSIYDELRYVSEIAYETQRNTKI